MVRESSAVMLGHYFKRRRQFVEMIAMSGEGVGIALFSVILKEGVGYVKINFISCFFFFINEIFSIKFRKLGWRLGLQAVTGLVSLSFFMGLLYRPASLYHPQRRAILHLKNQRKKVIYFIFPYIFIINKFDKTFSIFQFIFTQKLSLLYSVYTT